LYQTIVEVTGNRLCNTELQINDIGYVICSNFPKAEAISDVSMVGFDFRPLVMKRVEVGWLPIDYTKCIN